MGARSKIEWTTHTFNPWWGCTKVSEACKNCYAEAWAKRLGQKVWGPTSSRRFFGDHHWNEPIKWNRSLEGSGVRHRVFCASMADVFEERSELDEQRVRLWKLIEATPNLDWLLLTKRPQAVERLQPWSKSWPDNVWLGTTVENQKRGDESLPYLLASEAKVKFISAEPLLEALNLAEYLAGLDWVITGGESGPGARPADPAWFQSLRDQCEATNVAFHFKQWGDWAPLEQVAISGTRQQKRIAGTQMARVGKKVAGRELDGKLHDGLPTVFDAA